jgi:hypothetical protein
MASTTVSLLLRGFGVNEECTLSPRRLQSHLSSDYAPSSLYKALVHTLRLSELLFSPSGIDVEKLGTPAYCRAPEGVAAACKDVTTVLV